VKSAILVLAALVSTVQTVGWVECCCILICKHHNDPCKDDCKDKPQKATADCCEKPASRAPVHQHDQRCSHVEPSSEILTASADHPVADAVLVAEVPVAILLPLPAEAAIAVSPAAVPRGSPPLLHLLFATLLI